jgi:hypothetical protein
VLRRIFTTFALMLLALGCESDGGDTNLDGMSVGGGADIQDVQADEAEEETPEPEKKCIGSDIQPSFAQFDDECADIEDECQIIPQPEPFTGCYCMICGFLGNMKKCFLPCCTPPCIP